jgi:hypothetical protein
MIFDAVGSARSDNPTGSSSRRLVCAEIAAGNERTASLLELPGLAVWVHSAPMGPVDAGGDVHYVSLCPSRIVSRIALPAGDELGRDGLMSIARGLDARSAEAFGAQLTAALGAFRAGGEPLDDQTIIVLRRNDV